ncbi:hypothetical protein KCU77_g9802, partial [Aureobasidium melanogenum]
EWLGYKFDEQSASAKKVDAIMEHERKNYQGAQHVENIALVMDSLYEANGFKTTVLHRQYGYFKHRPGETLIGTRVKFMTLKPGDFASKLNHEQNDWDSLDPPDDISTEKYLKYHLEEKLRSSAVGDSTDLNERALILTIAAAFFIPLSFIASIFGMNVKEPLFPPSKPKHASKTTTTSHTISPTPTASADSSGPSQHYWTMSQYLEISLPLTVGVILLPLIAGPWLRLASQQYDINRRHWRALFVVFSACYFVALFVAFYIGSRGWDEEDWDNWIATWVYLAAGYSVIAIIGIARTVAAYRNKKGRLR